MPSDHTSHGTDATTGTDAPSRPSGRVVRAQVVCAAALLAGVASLTWRIGWTLSGATWWLAAPLLVAEAWALVRLALIAAVAWPTTGVAPAEAGESDEPAAAPTDVEMLVPAAHATADELVRTLVVAATDRPDTIRVLDRRHRADLAREARRHGATYEVHTDDRGPDTPTCDRTALVADAMRTSEAGVVVWVDAGDVLAPGFGALVADCSRTDVAVVQAVTDYANRDSLLHSRPGGDERALDERVLGPAMGRLGAGPWSGSGSVVRREAIEAIGGFADSTERTARRLGAAGWRVEFRTDPAVRTSAPDTLGTYLASVDSRAREPWRLLTTADGPVRGRRLPWRVRAGLLESATRPLDGVHRLVLLGVLAATAITGRLPLTASIAGLVAIWLPASALRARAHVVLARGALRPGDLTRQSLRRLGVHLRIVAGRPPLDRRDVDRNRSVGRAVRIAGRLPLVTGAAIVLNAAVVARLATFWSPDLLRPLGDTARIVVMGAIVATLVPIVDVLQVLVLRQQRRLSHRIGATLIAEVDGVLCRAHDLTPRGLGFDLVDAPDIGTTVPITLAVPRASGDVDDIALTGRVVHVSEPRERARIARLGGTPMRRVGVELVETSPAARDALVEICALTAGERDRLRDQVAQVRPDDLDVPTGAAWRTTLAALNVVGVLAAGLVVAGAPAGAEIKKGSEPVVGTATISGQVVGRSGEALADLCVSIVDDAREPVVTDGKGWFRIDGLPAGDHRLRAHDCVGRGGYVDTYFPSALSPDAAEPFHVDEGTYYELTITAIPTGRPWGRVVDEGGKPIEFICVDFAPTSTTTTFRVGTTDAEGWFHGDVPATEGSFQYVDCAWPARFASRWYPGTEIREKADVVTVPEHDKVELTTMMLVEGARLTGHITDEDGAPVPEACVTLVDRGDNGQWNWLAWTRSDKEGMYDFVVPEGPHSLLIDDCREEPTLAGGWYGGAPSWTYPAPTIDIGPGVNKGYDQRLVGGGRLAGRLTGPDGESATNVCVAVHPAVALLEHNDWSTAYWGPVDEKGGWLSTPLPPEKYLIQYVNCDEDNGYRNSGIWREEFHDGVFTDDGTPLSKSMVVGVDRGSEPIRLDHTLQRFTGITGTVTRKGTPLANVCVGSATSGRSTRTGEDGTYSLPVRGGDHAVTFTDCQPGRALTQVVEKTSLKDGEVTQLDVEMRSGKPGTLRGTVTTTDGSTVRGVCVIAFVRTDAVMFGLVEKDGTWTMEGLGAGRYWVAAVSCDNPGTPIVDPDTGKVYDSTWFPSAPADTTSEVDPERDGAKLVEVAEESTTEGLMICIGSCGVEAPTTTVPPITVPTTTTTTIPPTTVPPTTVVPTTAAPTTVPPTTVAPTTVPATTPTAPPTTAPPTTTRPTTWPSRAVVPASSSPDAGDLVIPRRPRSSTVPTTDADDATDERTGDPGRIDRDDTAASAASSSSDSARSTSGKGDRGTTRRTTDDDDDEVVTDVNGVSVRAERRTTADTPEELASRERSSVVGVWYSVPLDRPWVTVAGLAIAVAGAGALIAIRRRRGEG